MPDSNNLFYYIVTSVVTAAIGAIVWLWKGGKKVVFVDSEKTETESNNLKIDGLLKATKFYQTTNENLEAKIIACQAELLKQTELNKNLEKLIDGLREELRLARVQITLYETMYPALKK